MNTQADNQATGASPALSARMAPVFPITSVGTESGKESGSSGKEGTPRPRRRSATRNLTGDQEKLKAKCGSQMKSSSGVQPTSPKRKTRARRDKIIAQTAVNTPMEEMPPPGSKVSAEQAVPFEADRGFEPARLLESEIQAEPSRPAPDFSAIDAIDETDWPGAGVLAAGRDTLRWGEPAPQAAKRGLLTVTLRVRHSPLSFALKSLVSLLTQGWNWTQQKLKSPRGKKRLRVCESVSLGEKRFVAVIQVDGEQFLVGGSASSVSTLAHLERSREFSEVFERHCNQDLSPA
jgi:hypothetical protein